MGAVALSSKISIAAFLHCDQVNHSGVYLLASFGASD
jgi:hypothetical protein